MPDGPIPTPDEERLLRMLNGAGSPEAAGKNLVESIADLEAQVAALAASLAADPAEPELDEPPMNAD